MKKHALLYYSFLVFWICGIVSVLVDLDHIWKIFGLQEPFNFTGWIGRPLHNPIIFGIYSFIISWTIITFTVRWNVRIYILIKNSKNKKMQINDEIRYFEEWSRLWRAGWILKIAKTGNIYISYETENFNNFGMNDTIDKKWVKPTESKHEGFIIVENMPKKIKNLQNQ